jgi:hypothetical protein
MDISLFVDLPDGKKKKNSSQRKTPAKLHQQEGSEQHPIQNTQTKDKIRKRTLNLPKQKIG